MKTAEEWIEDELGFSFIDSIEPQIRAIAATHELVKSLEKFLLDAYKAGMTESAEIAKDYRETMVDTVGRFAISNAIINILHARDNKTEI